MSLQEKIIQALGVQPTINPEEEVRKSVEFLKDYMKKHPFLKTYVLGISGGQDSSLAGRLAQLAMEELRVELNDDAYQFIAVRLPYGNQADEEDANRALKFIQADRVYTVNIKAPVDGQVVALEEAGVTVSDFNMQLLEKIKVQSLVPTMRQKILQASLQNLAMGALIFYRFLD